MKNILAISSLIITCASMASSAQAADERYEVTANALSCNDSPSPCYHNSCQVTVFTSGSTVRLSDYTYDSRGVKWGREHYNDCWVSFANSSWLREIREGGNGGSQRGSDINQIRHDAAYIVSSPDGELNCRPGPSMGNTPRTVFYNGDYLEAISIVDSANGKPWMRVRMDGHSQRYCFVRASRRYIYEEVH